MHIQLAYILHAYENVLVQILLSHVQVQYLYAVAYLSICLFLYIHCKKSIHVAHNFYIHLFGNGLNHYNQVT